MYLIFKYQLINSSINIVYNIHMVTQSKRSPNRSGPGPSSSRKALLPEFPRSPLSVVSRFSCVRLGRANRTHVSPKSFKLIPGDPINITIAAACRYKLIRILLSMEGRRIAQYADVVSLRNDVAA